MILQPCRRLHMTILIEGNILRPEFSLHHCITKHASQPKSTESVDGIG